MLEDQETSVSGGVCLLILCGIPGSGKTRLATSLLEQCNQPANKTTDKRGTRYNNTSLIYNSSYNNYFIANIKLRQQSDHKFLQH